MPILKEMWTVINEQLYYFNSAIFLASCLVLYLLSLLLYRPSGKKFSKEESQKEGLSYFHHVDADDIEFQKLMISYDQKNRMIDSEMTDLKLDKI